MSIIYHERPGVYSDFDASSVAARGAGVKVVGLVGISTAAAGVYTVTAYRDGAATFGEDSQLAKLLKLAFLGGAGTVLAYPVATEQATAYATAVDAILARKQAKILVVGAAGQDIQTMVRDKIRTASSQKGECIGLVGMQEPTAEQLIARATLLNDPRMVLVGADVYLPGQETPAGGCMAAAALAGVLAAQADPAMPLNGQILQGLSGVSLQPDDNQLDALIQGGVTMVEVSGGAVTVIRGMTTCTTAGGVADDTYRELNTMLIIDDVIPGIRESLRAKFARAKNNLSTRSAIRSQVIVELESRVAREIIDGYEGVSVRALEQDPTVCQVEFGMTVTHGLNRIYLTAHIKV